MAIPKMVEMALDRPIRIIPPFPNTYVATIPCSRAPVIPDIKLKYV